MDVRPKIQGDAAAVRRGRLFKNIPLHKVTPVIPLACCRLEISDKRVCLSPSVAQQKHKAALRKISPKCISTGVKFLSDSICKSVARGGQILSFNHLSSFDLSRRFSLPRTRHCATSDNVKPFCQKINAL